MFCPLLLPPATKLWQGNILTGVCDSVHRGVCLSACWHTPPPRGGRLPPGPGTPPPPEQSILGDTVNEQAVCTSYWNAILFLSRSCGKIMFLHLCVILFTGGSGRQPPTPSRRYPSYCNAFLLHHCFKKSCNNEDVYSQR